jgi:hypothetical protein
MADRCTFAFARRDAPGVLQENPTLSNQRAQGRPGARHTRGLMCDVNKKMLPMSIQVWRKLPAFPAQWLYGLYAFAPVTGFLATVISEKLWASAKLDASVAGSGPHDFAVR